MKRSSIGGEEDKTRGSHRIDLDEQIPTSRLQLPTETRRDPEEGELKRQEKNWGSERRWSDVPIYGVGCGFGEEIREISG
jgi:hypothetical protein